MLKKTKSIIEKIENYPTKLWQILVWFYFVILTRTLFEVFSDNLGNFHNIKDFLIYYPAYYFAAFSLIILIFYLFTKTPILKILKVVLFGSVFIFIAPLIDTLFPFSPDFSYYTVDNFQMLFKSMITLGLGGNYLQGSSLGIKIELIFSFFGVFSYLILKNVNLIKSLIGSFTNYTFLWLLSSITSYYAIFYKQINLKYYFNSPQIGLSYLILTSIFILIIFFINDKEKFYKWIKSIEWFQTSITIILFSFGCLLYLYQRFDYTIFTANPIFYLIRTTSAIITIFIVWQIARIFNDLADNPVDIQFNKKNLLKTFSHEEIKNILFIYISLLILFAFSLSNNIFILLLICLGLSYLYSFEPIRLKRHFLLYCPTEAFAFLLIFFTGYQLYFIPGDSMLLIPTGLSIIIFIILTISISFKDIKDETSDRYQNTVTLFTLLKKEKASHLIALLILIASIIPTFYFKQIVLIIPSIIAFCLMYYITKGFVVIKQKAIIITILLVYILSIILIINTTTISQNFGNYNLNKDAGWHPNSKHEIWFISSFVKDEYGNQYYLSQTFNPANGSFLTLVNLKNGEIIKEFYPKISGLAITKQKLNISQYLTNYSNAHLLKTTNKQNFKFHSAFNEGIYNLKFKQTQTYQPILLSKSGQIKLKNNDSINYYAIPNYKVDGFIHFKNQDKIKVNGNGWLEHLWGNFTVDYKNWQLLNIDLNNDKKIVVIIFDYSEDILIYSAILENNKINLFNPQIKISKIYKNPETQNSWITEFELLDNQTQLNLKFKTFSNDFEKTGHNLWEGLMQVTGTYQNNEIQGWSNFRSTF